MAWVQISLYAREEDAETYSDCLTASGAVAVTFEDAEDKPLFEPLPGTTPLWHKTRVIGLYDADVNVSSIKKFIKKQLGNEALQQLEVNTLAEKNWTRAWMDQFQPMRFGQKLMICPTHIPIPDPNAINIILDPGMAFGTGTHPTTRLCLEWLDQHPPENLVVIDYGCGSGILGIAALKLGASFIYAIDHDPQALESTKSNAKQNGYDELKIKTVLPNEFQPAEKVDLILANILANPLLELAPLFTELLRAGGTLVLSGILENQTNSIIERYQDAFSEFNVVKIDGWSLIYAIKTMS